MTKAAYIVSAVRTPIGKFGGALAEFSGADLGVVAVRAAMERAFGAVPAERKAGDTKSGQAGMPVLHDDPLRRHWRH